MTNPRKTLRERIAQALDLFTDRSQPWGYEEIADYIEDNHRAVIDSVDFRRIGLVAEIKNVDRSQRIEQPSGMQAAFSWAPRRRITLPGSLHIGTAVATLGQLKEYRAQVLRPNIDHCIAEDREWEQFIDRLSSIAESDAEVTCDLMAKLDERAA